MQSMWIEPILAVFFGYMLGSIPFGLLLTQLTGSGDLRTIGSGNIGATNVLRTGNKAIAALTLLLDVGKGAAAVLVAASFSGRIGRFGRNGRIFGAPLPCLAEIQRWQRRCDLAGHCCRIRPYIGYSLCRYMDRSPSNSALFFRQWHAGVRLSPYSRRNNRPLFMDPDVYRFRITCNLEASR